MRATRTTLAVAAIVLSAALAAGVPTAAATLVAASAGTAATSCSCATTTGPFVTPAAGSLVSGQQTTSASGTYTASWSGGNVTVSKNGQAVFTVQGTVGGFSPNEGAFVAETSSTISLYNLNAPNPGTSVWNAGTGSANNVTSNTLVFSPSGHYLLYGDTTSDNYTHLTLADATAISLSPAVYTASFSPSGGAPTGANGDGDFGAVRYGFGPDDSRFVYGYTTASNQVTWAWTDLAANPAQTFSDSNLTVTSSYIEFSPCGNALAVVQSSGQDTVSVDLFDSASNTNLGAATGQTTSPVTLSATSTSFVATIGSQTYTLAPNNCTSTSGGGGSGSGGTPTASFTAPSNLQAGVAATFTDTSTDSGGTIVSWHWDFGDGTTSTVESPSHTYTDPKGGTYTVTLTVTDGGSAGATSTATQQVQVAATPPPQASFSYSPDPPSRGDQVTLTDTSTSQVKIVQSDWALGGNYAGSGSTYSLQICQPVTVDHTVVDSLGQSASTTGSIVVSSTGQVISVSSGGSLADALKHACSGDTIQLGPGTYQGGVTLPGVNLTGAGEGTTVVSGVCSSCSYQGPGPAVLATAPTANQDVTVSNLSVRGGTVGIEVDGSQDAASQKTVIDSVQVDHNGPGGGGIIADTPDSNLTVEHSSIHDNSGSGGISMECCSLFHITDNEIYSNSSDTSGGGVSGGETGDFVFEGNYVHDNTAAQQGGGLELFDAVGGNLVLNNRFFHNSATDGGGVYVFGGSPASFPIIGGNLIAQNTGGGLFYSGAVEAVNDTIADNSGTGIYGSTDPLWLWNSIVGGNTTNMPADSTFCGYANDLLGTLPAFADRVAYRLVPGSAAVDAGSNALVPAALATDAYGNPRIVDGNGDGIATVDLGYAELAGTGGTGGAAAAPTGCDPALRQDASGSLTPGKSLSAGAAPSAAAPLQTTVTAPSVPSNTSNCGGPCPYDVQIDEAKQILEPGPALSQWNVTITAWPGGSSSTPYAVAFALDSSLVGSAKPTDVSVKLGGQTVPDCSATGTASPDPCVARRTALASGGIELDVLSAGPAGDWTFASDLTNGPSASFTDSPDGLSVSFDASGSSDSNGTIASYAWDFGDGTTGSGATPTHTYASAGSYTVKLTVTDDKGATSSVSHDVTVGTTPAPPGSPQPSSGGSSSPPPSSGGSSTPPPSSGGSSTPAPANPGTGATAAQLRAALVKVLAVVGKAARIAQLLSHGGYTATVTAPAAGRLVISWYLVPAGAHLSRSAHRRGKRAKARPVLVATGSLALHSAARAKLKIALTRAGRQVLGRARHLTLTAEGSFTPVGGTTTTTAEIIHLRR